MSCARVLPAFGIWLALSGCIQTKERGDETAVKVFRSVTEADYAGKKYYLGWGELLSGFMGNETAYDVKHTHDVFASQVGGNYQAKTFVNQQFDGRNVIRAMTEIRQKLTKEDMYVQYSSGHGYQGQGADGGLGIGIDYGTIVNNALSSSAKEVVIFTMACYSGAEVDAFNARLSEWQDWRQKGRTLFVMSSSRVSEESATGPGTDEAEAGPQGSAGSAYGHALWKSLAGDADGFVDGVKDGFISLGEIAAYATALTKQIGGHTPQVTGSYDPLLIMNKVPDAAWVDAHPDGTESMSLAEKRAAFAKSDARMVEALGRKK